MLIESKFYGTVDVPENQVYQFKNGIPAFETEREFALMPLEGTPFVVLQSTKNVDLTFMMFNPWLSDQSYEFDLADEMVNELKIEAPEDLNVYVVATLNPSTSDVTLNLVAPIVLNQKNQQGAQVVLEKTTYTTKHRLVLDGEQFASY